MSAQLTLGYEGVEVDQEELGHFRPDVARSEDEDVDGFERQGCVCHMSNFCQHNNILGALIM